MMMHTPGPWKVFWAEDAQGNKRANLFIGIGAATGEGIADSGFGVWGGGSEEAAANARLIAAAPDLLSALEEIAKGKGAFDNDPLTHAANTIDDMKTIACTAIALAKQDGAAA